MGYLARIRILYMTGIPVYMFMVLEARVVITRNTERCSPNQYLKRLDNGSSVCVECFKCPAHRPEVKPCSDTEDTVCSCPDGKYVLNGQCKKCRLCHRGKGVKRRCRGDRNTVCEACPPGTFSSVISSVSRCRSCAVCKHHEERQNCLPKKNTVCGDCEKGYFRSTVLNTCERCSYCFPEFPNATFKVKECETKTDDPDYTCIPLDRPPYGFTGYPQDSTTPGHNSTLIMSSYEEKTIFWTIVIFAIVAVTVVIITLVAESLQKSKQAKPFTNSWYPVRNKSEKKEILRIKSVESAAVYATDDDEAKEHSDDDVTEALVHMGSWKVKISPSTLSVTVSDKTNTKEDTKCVSINRTAKSDKSKYVYAQEMDEDEQPDPERIQETLNSSWGNDSGCDSEAVRLSLEVLQTTRDTGDTPISGCDKAAEGYFMGLADDSKLSWTVVDGKKRRKMDRVVKSLPNIHDEYHNHCDTEQSAEKADMKRYSADAIIIGRARSNNSKKQNCVGKNATKPRGTSSKRQRCPLREVGPDIPSYLRLTIFNPT